MTEVITDGSRLRIYHGKGVEIWDANGKMVLIKMETFDALVAAYMGVRSINDAWRR